MSIQKKSVFSATVLLAAALGMPVQGQDVQSDNNSIDEIVVTRHQTGNLIDGNSCRCVRLWSGVFR